MIFLAIFVVGYFASIIPLARWLYEDMGGVSVEDQMMAVAIAFLIGVLWPIILAIMVFIHLVMHPLVALIFADKKRSPYKESWFKRQ